MFKSCCTRPNKKISKSKSKSEEMSSSPESEQNKDSVKDIVITMQKDQESSLKYNEPSTEGVENTKNEINTGQKTERVEVAATCTKQDVKYETNRQNQGQSKVTFGDSDTHELSAKKDDRTIANKFGELKSDQDAGDKTDDDDENEEKEEPSEEQSKVTFEDPEMGEGDILDLALPKKSLSKKRYSVDYKRSRLDFKRFSVDCRRDSATLEELTRLEHELARTNVDVRPGGRRKSTGILKSTTSSSNDVSEQRSANKLESDDDEVFEESVPHGDKCGTDPPATPVGRDELALRRHRFFSDLVIAARAAVEHRVRFDPLGPIVAEQNIEPESSPEAISLSAKLDVVLERLEVITAQLVRLNHLPAISPATSPVTDHSQSPLQLAEPIHSDNMSVNGYQDIMQGPLRTYLQLSQQIGGDVATQAELVNKAFQAQFSYIQLATQRAKPSQGEESQLLKPTSDQINAIQQFREKNRASPLFNHLSAISESIPALGWVAVSPTPAPYVKEMNDAGQFYTNRVLKDWKEKNKKHVEWCRTWVQLLTDLQAFVKQHHTTGLVWSGKSSGAGVPPPPPGGMPPPPPVLPDVDFSNMSVDDRSALFAEINQGENITSSLRKVTSEMQTHKNPGLRTGPAPFKAAAPAARAGKPLPQPGAGQLPDKPPVFTRDGKKWLIEYQKGNQNLLVDNADMNNVVYMFRCRDSALTVKGKINGVVLDSCTKCAVVFDNLVSSVEFVNCQSVQMQVLGKVPTISIDKTDGCQIYLSKDSLEVEIVSSKSSEMNVLVPKSNGDYTEYPVPEQFKTMLNKPRTGLSTTPVENKG